MSFIRRADGITEYSGNHVGSRGSLSSIKHTGGENFDLSGEDKEWEKIVLASSVTHEESFGMRWRDEDRHMVENNVSDQEIYVISQMWGTYVPIKSVEFNEKYFIPEDH